MYGFIGCQKGAWGVLKKRGRVKGKMVPGSALEIRLIDERTSCHIAIQAYLLDVIEKQLRLSGFKLS